MTTARGWLSERVVVTPPGQPRPMAAEKFVIFGGSWRRMARHIRTGPWPRKQAWGKGHHVVRLLRSKWGVGAVGL